MPTPPSGPRTHIRSPRQVEPWREIAARFAGTEVHVVGLASTESTAFIQAVSALHPVRWILHDFAPDRSALWQQFSQSHVALAPARREALFRELIDGADALHLRSEYLSTLDGAEWVFAPQSWDLYPQNAPLKDWKLAHPQRWVSLMDLYLKALPCQVVGVTGTNGKTTVTSLLTGLLEAEGRHVVVGGNHRYHEQLLPDIEAVPANAVAVLEISHKHLEQFEASVDVAVITNVAGDHLDELGWPDYVARKRRLVETLHPGAWAVVGAECPTTAGFAGHTAAQLLLFSAQERPGPGPAAWLEGGKLCLQTPSGETHRWPRSALRLAGLHNARNALAALAAASCLGCSLPSAEVALRAFRGVKHRLELLRTVGGVKVYDDTAATSPAATCAALAALAEEGLSVVVVVGGRDKANDLLPLAQAVADYACGVVLAPGSAANALAPHLPASMPVRRVGSLTEALQAGLDLAQGTGALLVSPSGAAFLSAMPDGAAGLRTLVRGWGRS